MSEEHVVTVQNFGRRIEIKNVVVMVLNAATGFRERKVKAVNKEIYTPKIAKEELDFLLTQDLGLEWMIWNTGAPFPKAYGAVYHDRQIFVSKRMARKCGLIDEDGNIVPPNTLMKATVESDFEDPLGEEFESLDTILNEKNRPSTASTEPTKADLEISFTQILTLIGTLDEEHGKVNALAFKKHLVGDGVLKSEHISANNKDHLREAIDAGRDYLDDPDKYEVEEKYYDAAEKALEVVTEGEE